MESPDIPGRFIMTVGGTLDLSNVKVEGLEWKSSGSQSEIQAAFAVADRGGSVILLHQFRNQHKTVAGRTRGIYSIMENLNGDYMHDKLRKLEQLGQAGYAKWLGETAKDCFSRLGTIDATVIGRLDRNQTLVGLRRPTIVKTIAILESVREKPSLAALSEAMYLLTKTGEGICYAHEAWYDMANSLGKASVDDTRNPNEHLVVIRNRLRYSGRKSREKLLSKTLLVKGLEYDHAIIANADAIGHHKHLYVAMTRPRKTLTILSAKQSMTTSYAPRSRRTSSSRLSKEPTRRERADAAQATIVKYRELIDLYIKLKEDNGDQAQAVSLAKTEDTHRALVEQVRTAILDLEHKTDFYDRSWTSYDEAYERVMLFKQYVENQDGYKVINRGNGEPFSNEPEVQLFFGLIWMNTDFDVNREPNNGRGPVDFKISFGAKDKSLIEFKLARSTSLKRNLEKQIAIYEKANKTHTSVKAIICYTAQDQVKLEKVLKELGLENDESIVAIDARSDNKVSASKA